jgi:hypothetical protein
MAERTKQNTRELRDDPQSLSAWMNGWLGIEPGMNLAHVEDFICGDLCADGVVLDENRFFVRRADGMIRFDGAYRRYTESEYSGLVVSSLFNYMLKRIG